jgi:hypothetical protein
MVSIAEISKAKAIAVVIVGATSDLIVFNFCTSNLPILRHFSPSVTVNQILAGIPAPGYGCRIAAAS